MSLSNTAVPIYYGQFRDAVLRGDIPVCKEVAMEMDRIDALIDNPGVYYDDKAVEGFIRFCENELVLTDGSDVTLWIVLSFGLNRYLAGITSSRSRCLNETRMGKAVIIFVRELRNV